VSYINLKQEKMNDIAKQATADKFLQALKKEHLSKKEAGKCIGFTDVQVSYLFNKHYWDRLGNVYWDKVLVWVNSGQGLKEFGVKHGKVVTVDMRGVDTTKTSPDDILKTIAKSAERKIKRAEKKKIITEKQKNEETPKEDYAVSQAQIGEILHYNKEGMSAEKISLKLKIYLPIVRQIITGIPVPLHESYSVLDKRYFTEEELFTKLLKEKKASILKEIDPVIVQKLEAIDVLLKLYTS